MSVVSNRFRYHTEMFNLANVVLKRDAPHPSHLVDVLDDRSSFDPEQNRFVLIARDLTEQRGLGYIVWTFVTDGYFESGALDNGRYGMTLDTAVQEAYRRLTA